VVKPVEKLSVPAVVGLVNEYADATRIVAGESDESYTQSETLDSLGATTGESVALANDLYPVFASPRDAVERLNQLADQHHLEHRLASDGRLAWMSHAASRRAAAAATVALIDFVNQHGSDRLGTCDANACVDVYIDSSQGQTRSYCSDKCHTRTRVANWRARQRTAISADSGEENR
jgi:predicted RNA-binding Zn ribbon-like protein